MTSSWLPLPELGLTLAAYEAGDPAGPPLLLLHGNSGAATVFGRQWAAPELQGFRLVAFDLPGHGQSPPAPGHYGIGAMRKVVRAALRALGLHQALAVGHSYGGHLLLELLPDLPTLQGLLAVGAPPVSTLTDLTAAFSDEDQRTLFYSETLTTAQTQALARYCLRPAAPGAEVALVAAALARTDSRARPALLASVAAGELGDEVGHVARTAVPLALAAGQHDATLRPVYFDTLVAPSRWGPPLHVLPGAGHVPFLEHPAAFHRLLLAFAAATA